MYAFRSDATKNSRVHATGKRARLEGRSTRAKSLRLLVNVGSHSISKKRSAYKSNFWQLQSVQTSSLDVIGADRLNKWVRLESTSYATWKYHYTARDASYFADLALHFRLQRLSMAEPHNKFVEVIKIWEHHVSVHPVAIILYDSNGGNAAEFPFFRAIFQNLSNR